MNSSARCKPRFGLSDWAKPAYHPAMARGTNWVWIPFLALGLMWGTSYLWIKIGLETLPPLTLIAGRLLFGGAFLAIVVAIARQELPRARRQYEHLLVMSVVNIVIPFMLITYGEQSMDSALAAILNATVPLTVIVHRADVPARRDDHGRQGGRPRDRVPGRGLARRAGPHVGPGHQRPGGADDARRRRSATASATSTRGATSAASGR